MTSGSKQRIAQNELWLSGTLAVVGIIERFFNRFIMPIRPGRRRDARLLEDHQWIEAARKRRAVEKEQADRKRRSSERELENMGWEQRAWEDDED